MTWPWETPGKEIRWVNLATLPIGKEELKTAFAVSENQLWYRAILQTLETRRLDCLDSAASATVQNNPMRIAAMTGAAYILGEVISDLQNLRKQSVSE